MMFADAQGKRPAAKMLFQVIGVRTTCEVGIRGSSICWLTGKPEVIGSSVGLVLTNVHETPNPARLPCGPETWCHADFPLLTLGGQS
jgi:hypothetical protein